MRILQLGLYRQGCREGGRRMPECQFGQQRVRVDWKDEGVEYVSRRMIRITRALTRVQMVEENNVKQRMCVNVNLKCGMKDGKRNEQIHHPKRR